MRIETVAVNTTAQEPKPGAIVLSVSPVDSERGAAGARDAGCRALLLDRAGTLAPPDGVESISSLDDVRRWLEASSPNAPQVGERALADDPARRGTVAVSRSIEVARQTRVTCDQLAATLDTREDPKRFNGFVSPRRWTNMLHTSAMPYGGFPDPLRPRPQPSVPASALGLHFTT